MSFDPRTVSTPVYEALHKLRSQYDNFQELEKYKAHLQEHKSQAVQLYSYISSWGLMRLKGEEIALDKWTDTTPSFRERIEKSQEGRREVIETFFQCLQKVSKVNNLAEEVGLATLKNMKHSQYLGLTGLALALAKEFSFWADAVYHDIKAGES
ncbi:MAG: hypothetical protein WBG70_21800 [Spirulinaceae cyanobacterium]